MAKALGLETLSYSVSQILCFADDSRPKPLLKTVLARSITLLTSASLRPARGRDRGWLMIIYSCPNLGKVPDRAEGLQY